MSSALRARIKHFLKRLIVVGISLMLGVALLAYIGDYLLYRYRIATNRQPFGEVTVYRYDAVLQKSGKTQYIFNPPQAETCVQSLFPHAGFTPCWYLRRHNQPRTNI